VVGEYVDARRRQVFAGSGKVDTVRCAVLDTQIIRSRFVGLLSLLWVGLRLGAQQAGSLDTNYIVMPGTDIAPGILAPMPDGRLYIGGTFTNYGGTGLALMARLQVDGRVDPGFVLPPLREIQEPVFLNGQLLVPGSTNSGRLGSILALPDGRPVIAGWFTHIGAEPAPAGMAILNLDGSPAVTSFDLEEVETEALLAGPGDTFYAGGKGNLASRRLPLLRFRFDGSRDAGFTTPTLLELDYGSANPFVLCQGPGDTLHVVTASAPRSGFTPLSDILRLTATGALDTSFADGGKAKIPFASQSSFVTDPAGRMSMIGVTTYRGAALPRKIHRLNLDGSVDADYLPTADPGFGGRVVAVQSDGKLLFTGGTLPINRLNADGTVDTTYANPGKVPVTQNFLSLTRFAPTPEGGLFAAGFTFSPTFTMIPGVYRIFGDPNEKPTISLQPRSQTNTFGARTRFTVGAQGAAPFTYQWFRNGTVLAGETGPNLILLPSTAADADADFVCEVSNALGKTLTAAARLTLVDAGSARVYRETDVPVGANGVVTDLEFDPTGALLASGGFTTFHGTNRVRIARLLNRGSVVDPGFDTTALGNIGLVEEIVALRSGRVLGLGNLQITYNGVTHGGVFRLNTEGRLDTTFNPTGSGSTFGARVAEGFAGELFVTASTWNDVALPLGLGRLSADGLRDGSFVPSPGLQSGGLMIPMPDGGVIVPGGLGGLMRLNASGQLDSGFSTAAIPGLSVGMITSLVKQPDGRILASGSFTWTVGARSYALGVVRFRENGGLDPEFNPVPALSEIVGIPVDRMALQADGRIVVKGAFNRLGGYARPGLARLWPNGVVDPEFVPGVPRRTYLSGAPLGSVSAVAVSAENDLFLGGDFHEFDGLPRTNFVRLSAGPLRAIPARPTVTTQPLRVVAKAGESVTFAVEPGGDGPFQFQWQRNEVRGSARFVDIAGATNASLTLPSVRAGSPTDSGLFVLHVVNPGGVVTTRPIVLIVEPDPVVPGTLDNSMASLGVSGILSGQSQLAAEAPGGQLYVSRRTTLVRTFEDGTPDPAFQPPVDLTAVVDGGIAAVLRQPDGKVLIAGRFKTGALARLLPDGQLDPGFVQTNSYGGFFQSVPWELGLQSDGRILLAGTFENFAGRPVHGLIRFQANGEVDTSFPLTTLEAVVPNPQRVLPGSAVALRVLPDDRIYVGGAFSRVGGVTRIGVARLLPDGQVDPSFVPPTNGATPLGTGGTMLFYTLGPVTPAGGVYVFGTFRPVADGTVESALRLLPDGSVDGGFHVSTDFQINYGAVQRDGKLIVTGQFTRLNGQPRGGFARLNLDGSTDVTFVESTQFGVGASMQMLSDGKLLAGGVRYFTGLGPVLPRPDVEFGVGPAGLELRWPEGFRLQRATRLAPADWADVEAVSPYVIPTIGAGEFFRVIARP
jgi:uncharacterized delta-60 repeat protein